MPRSGHDRRALERCLALAATCACLLEVSAEKVGNVTPTRGFAGTRFADFALSAVAAGPALARARQGRVGEAIYRAVAATRRVTSTNTNLGIVLLLAPIAAAARLRGGGLHRRVEIVLRGLSRADARWAYRAIRLARPGGLGRSPVADVRRPPALGLREAMALAASRDRIAAEYAEGFPVTFGVALRGLGRALGRGPSVLDAVAQAHLEVLARVPDTLIARKAGLPAARRVSARADAVVRAGGRYTARGRAAMRRFDSVLRQGGHRLNPGTSADLVTAALFVWLLTHR
jgi:triphosphoribosyl-dephospho-CoA synthase